MDMKGRGMFIARTLSYRGAEFSVVDEDLSPEYRIFYNHCARLWGRMKKEFEKMKDTITARISLTRKEARSLTMVMGTFWGTHQRFFNQLCLGAKVPAVVRLARAALAEGQCVVIGLQSTGEARTDAHIAEHGFDGTDFLSTSKLFIQHVMTDIFKVGNEFECGAPAIPELKKIRKEILAEIEKLDWPPNPLDSIIDQLGGPDAVAEMTGRSSRTVRRPRAGRGRDGETKLVHEKRFKSKGKGGDIDDSINITERKNFQAGRKLVAIISDAASTGISLHADRRVKNTRRRLHITLELPWSADKAVQQLGRSHRSNQKSSPIFKLLITTIGGEWRFASAVASRLEQLGALTQGDRRAGGAQDMSDFVLDTKWGHDALNHMLANLNAWAAERPSQFPVASEFITDDYSEEEFATEAVVELTAAGVLGGKTKMKINTFLNRLFGVQLELQKNIFRHLLDTLDRVIVVAKQNNQYSEGITDVTGESMSVASREVLYTDPVSSGTVNLVTVLLDRGISWETALERYHKAKDDNRNVMFLKAKNPPFGYPRSSPIRQCSLVIARAGGNASTGRSMFYGMHKPAAGITPSDVHRNNLQDKNQVVNIFLTDPKFDLRPDDERYMEPSELTDPTERRVFDAVRGHESAEEDSRKGIWKTELAKKLELETDQLTASLKKLVDNRILKQTDTRTGTEKSRSYENYEKNWTREFTSYNTKCSHNNCHLGGDCDYGRRQKKIFVVTGSLLGIWGCLPKERSRAEEAKIVRISCDDGERVVGLRVMKAEQVVKMRVAIKEMEKEYAKNKLQATNDNPNPEPINLDSFAKPRSSKSRSGGAIRKRSRSGASSRKSSKGDTGAAKSSSKSSASGAARPSAPPSDEDEEEDEAEGEDDSTDQYLDDSATLDDDEDAEYYGDEDLDDCGMWEDVELDADDEAAFTVETTVVGKSSSQSSQSSQGTAASAAPNVSMAVDEDDEESDDEDEDEEETDDDDAVVVVDGPSTRSTRSMDVDDEPAAAAAAAAAPDTKLQAIWDTVVGHKVGSRVLSELFMDCPTEEEAPGYDEMISVPIDLNMIRDRLDDSSYTLIKMKKDMGLLKTNAHEYNESDSQIYRDAEALYNSFLVASGDGAPSSSFSLPWRGEDQPEYVVEKILDDRVNDSGEKEYQVHWKGYESSDDTWEPVENVQGNECFVEYMQAAKKEQRKEPRGGTAEAAEADESDVDEGNEGGDGFGPSDDEDEEEDDGGDVKEVEDEGPEEEMNEEDRDFIVDDGAGEDTDDGDDDDEDDDDQEDSVVDDDEADANAEARPTRGSARNAEAGDSEANDDWEHDQDDVGEQVEQVEEEEGEPPQSAEDAPSDDSDSSAAPSAAASAAAAPSAAAAAAAATPMEESSSQAMEAKAAAISAAREHAAAEAAASAAAAKAAVAGREEAAGPAQYELRQTNGPPLPCGTIALPGPTTGAHLELNIGRAAAKPPPQSGFRLRVLKGDVTQAVECQMTAGWSFRIGKVVPPGTDGLAISHTMLSRNHCTIFYDQASASFKLRDSSTNGTFIDGLRVGPKNAAERAAAVPRRLLDGNTVSLGDPSASKQLAQLPEADTGPFVFVFESTAVSQAAPVTPGAAASTAAASTAAAAASGSQLAIPDPKVQVSRKHCTIAYLPESDTFTVTDHGSLNGVFANRKKIQPRSRTPISVGTELVIGGYKPQLPVGSRLRKLEPWVFAFVVGKKEGGGGGGGGGVGGGGGGPAAMTPG
jgi:pSer/pThr/pTyr-binding forkhead associated (FHA) protein